MAYPDAAQLWLLPLAAAGTLVLTPARGRGEETERRVSWFEWERGRVVSPVIADPREARFRFGLLVDGSGELFEDIAWGGDLPFLDLTLADGSRLAVSGRGVMTARFDAISESFDLQNVDFIGGMALAYCRASWGLELLAVHQSSHLGDELMEQGRSRVDFGQERLRLLGDWRPVAGFRVYGGGSVVAHAWPRSYTGRTVLQAGTELEHRIFWRLPWFAAFDASAVVSKPGFGGVSVQTGIGLGNRDREIRRQSLFLEFYHGTSPMGQFYREVETYGLLGVGYEFR
jgi:hypothetical protein